MAQTHKSCHAPFLLLLGLVCWTVTGDTAPVAFHPWRPPYGLERLEASEKGDVGVAAAAAAHADTPVHPVDLGLIFVPDGWLVLSEGQRPIVDLAVISHARDLSGARVKAWFESAPKKIREERVDLPRGSRRTIRLEPHSPRLSRKKDTLHIAITEGEGEELWRTKVPAILVDDPPKLPSFGVTRLKLRYDLPIVLNRSESGQLDMSKISFLDYEKGWDESLDDVVVSLPNGSRFVFWRGSSYIPFWAGPRNTGVCYEWAETGPPPDGFVDSVEPLMDKELRYGRVEIVESTPARVHVRWTYQSTDFNYKVWGDGAVEDFYFYPDGYGTRVLSLKKRPDAQYELSEFIVLAAAKMYPLSFLPENAVEMIYLDDAARHTFHFPPVGYTKEQGWPQFKPQRPGQVIYRIHAHRDDPASAVYFHSSDDHFPMIQFGPFHDADTVHGDILVTPAYWGAHWPLTRGKSTGAKIDDLIHHSPSHNSLLSWAQNRKPDPDFRGKLTTLDTLGRSVEMTVEHYAWLIAMTAEPDAAVLDRARSFARPPSLEVEGSTLDWQSYAPARRAIRLKVTDNKVSISIKPAPVTVNPVFELDSAPPTIKFITLDGSKLPDTRYAWDGRTLWLDATIRSPQRLEVVFR